MAEPSKSPTNNQPPKDIMGWLEYYLVTKAPFQLPPNVKAAIVKYAPWVDVVLLVLFAPALLLLLGIGAVVLPFSDVAGANAAAGLSLALIVLVIQIVLMVAALPGLFKRQIMGWNLSFYGVVFNLVYSVVRFDILGGITSAVIGLYILFQIRSYYK